MYESHREVAGAILIGTCGRILLQQRDDIPTIAYPGMVGLFGGHRENSETFLECAQREIEEETGHLLPHERFEPLSELAVTYPEGGGLRAQLYVVRGLSLDALTITEGSPLITPRNDLPTLLHRMTPTACFAVRLFLQRSGGH